MERGSESKCLLATALTLCVVFLCLASPSHGHFIGEGAVFQEERLLTYLLDGYVKEARPVFRPDQAVDVSIKFSFNRIEDLIETTDTFAATLLMVQTWSDPRLRWNASDYGGIQEVRLAREKLWTPDIVLYNVAVQGTPEARYDDMVTVTSDGGMIWVPMVTMYATCPMDFTRFPYDIQTCTLVFGSWAHTAKQLAVSFLSTKQTETDVDMSDMEDSSFAVHEHPQWTVVPNSAKAKIYSKKYSCCVDHFTLISVTCSLTRKPQFYRHLTVGPAAVFGVLVPVLFLLPASTKEKTTYGLLLLVCLTMMMMILENAIPFSHGSLPHLASFYLGTMVLTCFSILLSVLIINLSSRGTRRKPLPAWIHTIFLGRMGLRRMLCLGSYSPVDNVYSTALRSDDALLPDASMDGDVTVGNALVAPSSGAEQQLREIHRCVRFIMGKMAADDSYRNVDQEWDELGRVMDRCLFIIFFVFYIFTAVSLLV